MQHTSLDLFQTLAMVLKRDWEAAEQPCRPNAWEPWRDPARYIAALPPLQGCPAQDRMALLLLEQCALGCHHLAAQDVAKLAKRHAQSTALLNAAPAETQQAFIADKRAWLLQEFELTGLIEMRQRLVDEMEGARIAFLAIMADAYALMIAAGHALALWRCRSHFDDVTLTFQEVAVLLALEQDPSGCGPGRVPLEPELRAALRDSVEEVASDQRVMRELSLLIACGAVEQASEEDQRRATELFRKLASILLDALGQHPEYASISPPNQRRLSQIWVEASGTHRVRVYLQPRKLLSYLQNLKAWQREVDCILRHLTFHDPGKLVEGNTLDEQWAFVGAALAQVQRRLHAMRDDLAQLQLDPRHDQHLRVMASSGPEREAERARMLERAQAWNEEAARIEARMLAAAAADAQADVMRLKGAKK